jgi:flagellin-like protein
MKKGISTIIATILLLIITISLTGTAYMFISGMIGTRISKAISADITCTNGKIRMIVYNQGTDMINNTSTKDDLKIYVNNTDQSDNYLENGVLGKNNFGIVPHGNIVLISNDTYQSGSKQSILIMTSSNSQTGDAFC